jgi:hypothetical protein
LKRHSTTNSTQFHKRETKPKSFNDELGYKMDKHCHGMESPINNDIAFLVVNKAETPSGAAVGSSAGDAGVVGGLTRPSVTAGAGVITTGAGVDSTGTGVPTTAGAGVTTTFSMHAFARRRDKGLQERALGVRDVACICISQQVGASPVWLEGNGHNAIGVSNDLAFSTNGALKGRSGHMQRAARARTMNPSQDNNVQVSSDDSNEFLRSNFPGTSVTALKAMCKDFS